MYLLRMLHAWLLQQEQKGDAAVRQQVSDARETLEEDRNQWVGDVIRSISRLADLDAAFFKDPVAWGNGDLNSSTAGNDNYDDDDDGRAATSWAGIQARHEILLAQEQHGRGAAEIGAAAPPPRGTAEGGHGSTTHPQPDSDFNSQTVAAEIEALAAEKRCARLEALARIARQGMEAHRTAFFREEMERTRIAATAMDLTAGRWAEQQRKTVGALRASWRGRDWLSTTTSRALGGGESDARETGSFVGVHGSGGEEGSGVRRTGASSTPPKTTTTTVRPACQAGDGRFERGVEKVMATHLGTQAGGQDAPPEAENHEEALSGTAAGRNAARAAGGNAPPVNGGSVYPCEDEPVPLFVGTSADAPIGIEDGAKGEGRGRQQGSGGDRGDDDSACVIVVKEVGASSGSGGLQATPSDAEAAETEAAETAAAATAGQLVVFVGRAMAFHTSTIRASHLENFHEENRRRRCSSFSAPPQEGQQEHRYRLLRAYSMHAQKAV